MALCCVDPTRLSPDVLAAHVAMARERQAMPWAQAAFLEAARSIVAVVGRRRELRAMIADVAAPTLVVQGAKDRLVPLAASRALAALRPDWSLAVLDDVGHVPQLEVPERFVATVLGWLDAPGREAARG
jgi:pimeloyl-ACP methyl ester carboxylesterase